MPWEKKFDVPQTLNKAMHVFWSRGYEATSVQDLIDEMGINRGSMYSTFGDKRSLFIAALRMYDTEFRKAQLAAIEQRHPGRAGIQALFDGWIDTLANDPGHGGCFLTNTALELAAHDPEIGAMVAESQEDIENFFSRQIRCGQAHGEIPGDRNPAELARTLLAMLLGLLVLGRSRLDAALWRSIVGGAMAALS
jgi:TetR/AcrR family transcriptional repressor of nem operon